MIIIYFLYLDKERKVIIRGTPKQVKLAYNLMKEVYDSLELKCSEDVAIKKISDSSSCNNDSSTSNNILNPILQQGTYKAKQLIIVKHLIFLHLYYFIHKFINLILYYN